MRGFDHGGVIHVSGGHEAMPGTERNTKNMKHTNKHHLVILVLGLAATLPMSAHPVETLHSPRGRAMAEDRRTISGVTPERLERRLTVGSPRGGANATVTAPGTTPDRLDRGPALGSPRGREAFGFMGGSR